MNFITLAQNTTKIDYLKLAYAQALSIKMTMPDSQYAVIVDPRTNAMVTERYRQVFDHVIVVDDFDETSPFLNEWRVYDLSPFDSVVKLESDLLFTTSIEHWESVFNLQDVVLSLGCRNFLQEISTSRDYRKTFDGSDLPDVYNGLMYFKKSHDAKEFFDIAKEVFLNWNDIVGQLNTCVESVPTTDVVYAIAAKILGEERCTLPSLDFINFVHVKPSINGWPDTKWSDLVTFETDLPMIRIANKNQYHPVHYHDKSFITDEIIAEYERGIK